MIDASRGRPRIFARTRLVGRNDLFATVRDVVGGRAGGYEKALRSARQEAIREMADRAHDLGADAVIGVDVDYEVLGKAGSMLMVTSPGTGVDLGSFPMG